MNPLRTLFIILLIAFSNSLSFADDLIIHYHRSNDDYDEWSLWTWETEEDGESIEVFANDKDDFGIIFKLDIEKYNSETIGILPKYQDWSDKDPPDRMWNSTMNNEIWFISTNGELFNSLNDAQAKIEKMSRQPYGNTISKWLPGMEEIPLVEFGLARDKSEDWRDEFIYFIMIDRFYDGDSNNNGPIIDGGEEYDPNDPHKFHGGDLQGIIEQIPYLRLLGVTAIWITPPIKNTWKQGDYCSYHGYWGQDFTQIDPHFGDNEKYKEFVDICHQNGILVIQDIVTQHIGNLWTYDIDNELRMVMPFADEPYPEESLVWYEDIIGSGRSGALSIEEIRRENKFKPEPSSLQNPKFYNRRGKIENWNNETQSIYGDFVGYLRDINTTPLEVAEEFANIYLYWIKEAGVDGFRIDTVRHTDLAFWPPFCSTIRDYTNETGENFLMFGEVLHGDDNYVNKFTQNNQLDGVVNFPLYYTIRDVWLQKQGTNQITNRLNNLKLYRQTPINEGGAGLTAPQCMVNFIDNHDAGRFLTRAGNNEEILWSSLIFLFTIEGIPCLYYGTEQNFTGASGDAGRKDMWSSGFEVFDNKTFNLVRILAEIRKENIALRRGAQRIIKDSNTQGVFAFERYTDNPMETILVVLNISDDEISTGDIKTSFKKDVELEDILANKFDIENKTIKVKKNGKIETTIEGYSARIFRLKR